VLVTGAGGFIGSHLAGALVRAGAEVAGFLRYTSTAATGTLRFEEAASEIELVRADLRDSEAVRAAVRGRDAVLHLGALVGIPYSYGSPRDVVETNVTGTLNVLQAARAELTGLVVCMSTSEVYGTPEAVPIREGDRLRPQSPYAASKVAADMLALSFHRTYGLPVALARPFNVYGPRQSARAVVPTVLSQALAGRQVRLGALEPVRDLTFVEDTVEGLLALGAWPEAPGATVAFGTGSGVSVAQLVELAGEVVGHELEVVAEPERVRPEGSEVDELVCDPALAERELGWRARTGLRDGLERTAAWIEEHLEEYRVGAYAV
jgi:nucleoside-diphosphate-sugar epimerase